MSSKKIKSKAVKTIDSSDDLSEDISSKKVAVRTKNTTSKSKLTSISNAKSTSNSNSGKRDITPVIDPISKSQDDEKIKDIVTAIDIENFSGGRLMVSDDTLDYLEIQVDKYNEMKNLGEKVDLNKRLNDVMRVLTSDIDEMTDLIGDEKYLQMELSTKDENFDDLTDDISDNIVKIENDVKNLSLSDECVNLQVKQYIKIIKKIRHCKDQYVSTKMKVTNCT